MDILILLSFIYF